MIARTVADLPGCTLVRGDPETLVRGVAIDSRQVRDGDLFVAIRGGHEHTDAAIAAGAAAVLVEQQRVGGVSHGVVLAAADTVAALQGIGAANRTAADATVVAITGSSGKTSTKDATATLVGGARRTIAAAEGHNNEIGLPLTLCAIAIDTEVCVCELAMRAPGQITDLTDLARPRIGVITNVGEAHLGELGSRAAIAAAKAELIASLPADGVAIVPDDAPLLDPHLRADLETLRHGTSARADVRVAGRSATAVELNVRGRRVTLATPLTSAHDARNLACAIGVCLALGLDLDAAAGRAHLIERPRWRGQTIDLPGGGILVNDAYNANPSSVRASLAAFVEVAGERRTVAILGVMAELGTEADELHQAVGAYAADCGVDVLIAVGELAAGYVRSADGVECHQVDDREGALALARGLVRPGDALLVKGSRSAGLEVVAQGLAEAFENGSPTMRGATA